MSLKDYIHTYNVEFPEDFLQKIIELYDDSMKPLEFPNDPSHSVIKNVYVTSLSNNTETSEAKEVDSTIFKQITELVKKYNEKYPFMKCKKDRGYHLIKIEKGGYHRLHIDNEKGITVIIKLHSTNDGYLSLLDGKHIPKLNKNQACIFPSNFTYPWSFEDAKNDTAYYLYTILNE